MKTERDRTIALTGIFQAAALTDQVAHQGQCDHQARLASIHSLLQVDAENVEAVYGGLQGIQYGLKTLQQQLTGGQTRNLTLSRYALLLIQLEGKLRARKELMERLSQGIQDAQRRLDHFAPDHPNLLAHFAGLYSNTVSTLKPRIMVEGDSQQLTHAEVVNQVRTLLLTGIRSAMLWRQCGGKRYQILFGGNRLLRASKELTLSIQ